MTTTGPAGELLTLYVALDREVNEDHYVLAYNKSRKVKLYSFATGQQIKSVGFLFPAGQGTVPQPVKMIGEVGTHPLDCEVTSAYYQSRGTQKIEKSTISLTFTDEPAQGFIGSIAGHFRAGNLANAATDSTGENLHYKYNNTNVSNSLIVGKTNHWGSGNGRYMRARVVAPNGAVTWTGTAVSGAFYVQINMTQIGVYRVYLYEMAQIFEVNSYPSVGNNTWYAKLNSIFNPSIDSTGIKANGYIFRKSYYKEIRTGDMHVFTETVSDALVDENLCGALSTTTYNNGAVDGFIGTSIGTGCPNMTCTGYYSATNGGAYVSYGQPHINGVTVFGPASIQCFVWHINIP